MAILGTTPTNIMTDGPSTLPKECYGVPGSRRWEVTTDPPPRDQNLGETMERYKRLFPDPRTNPRYSELTIGDRFPIENLPLVVVRELIKYLPPMDVIRMANLLDNFRDEGRHCVNRALFPMSEGDSDTEPGSDTEMQPSDPDSDSGQETEPNSPHSLREGGEMKGEPSKLKRENDSDTEPPSPIPPMEIEEVKGEPSKFKREDDSDTEPPSPIPPMEVEDMKGEPSKLKWEPDSDNEPDPPSTNFVVQEIEGSSGNMEQEPHQEPQPETGPEEPPSWPWTDPWTEPESPDMEEYYMSSDGVTRNYWFITYGPRQDQEE